MAKSLRIGRIAGTPISVDAGLVVLAVLFIASLAFQGLVRLDAESSVGTRLGVATATVAVFLASILAHELGHATVAKRRGVGVLGITLSLFGGYAQLDRQAPTPRAEFSIAAAGPAVNLVIGAVLGGVTYGAYRLDLFSTLVIGAMAWLAGVNIVLAILNLFPAAPLDGGRVLTAALWKRLDDAERARILSGRSGLVLGAVLAVGGATQMFLTDRAIGIWQGVIIAVVGLFLFNGARTEIGTATIRKRLQQTTTRDLMITDPPPVSDSLSVEQFHRMVGPQGRQVVYPVVRWTTDPIGYVTPTAGRDLSGLDRSSTTVHELMEPTPEVARAWMTEPIDDVLRRLGMPDNLVVVVHEPEAGKVVGTLCESQVEPLLKPPNLWGGQWRWREQPGAVTG